MYVKKERDGRRKDVNGGGRAGERDRECEWRREKVVGGSESVSGDGAQLHGVCGSCGRKQAVPATLLAEADRVWLLLPFIHTSFNPAYSQSFSKSQTRHASRW